MLGLTIKPSFRLCTLLGEDPNVRMERVMNQMNSKQYNLLRTG